MNIVNLEIIVIIQGNIIQNKLRVADITLHGHSLKSRAVAPIRKVWKLRDSTVRKGYETFVHEKFT